MQLCCVLYTINGCLDDMFYDKEYYVPWQLGLYGKKCVVKLCCNIINSSKTSNEVLAWMAAIGITFKAKFVTCRLSYVSGWY